MPKRIQEFVISALRIDQRCKPELRKVLKDEYYLFNKRCVRDNDGNIILNPAYHREYNVYGKKININTIVGKNGSGKSSLLEMIYRIVNNFSSLLVRDTRRGGAYPLYFIDGLLADLFYVIDNGEDGSQLACLSCRENEVVLIVDGNEILSLHLYGDNTKLNQADISMYWDKLFYTIVTNYSVQSFISTDYKEEQAYKVEPRGNAQLKDEVQWMSSLFHENDGYLTPIVLNPYRDENGNMNMANELHLTIARLTSILVFFKEKKMDFLEGYRLPDIMYQFDPQMVVDKFIGHFDDDSIIADSISSHVCDFAKYANTPNTYANIILKRCGFFSLDYSNIIIERAAAYLVYKILSIANKYPSYSIFKITKSPELFHETVDNRDKLNLGALVDEIIKDKSHITLKVRQTCRFLQLYRPNNNGIRDLFQLFSFSEYQEALKDSVNANSLVTLMEQIPPSFFVPTIYFDKLEDGVVKEVQVPLTQMSSGERQYLYNFSTVIYHMRNLLSIQDTQRVRYRSIHLVFDEVEICFHPEYQRKFINSLLAILDRTRIIPHCSVQITIATHSPFILSDVIQDNILYLKDGHDVREQITVNPFGANINDVLQQSFFLENGFMGEFVQRKINSLVDFLKEGKHNSQWSIPSARFFIENNVGDPVIKGLLEELLTEKTENDA